MVIDVGDDFVDWGDDVGFDDIFKLCGEVAEEAVNGGVAQHIREDVRPEEFGFEPRGVVFVVECLVVLCNFPFGVVGDHLGAKI